ARKEHQIGGALREAAHVPRKPLLAVADEHLHPKPLARKADLLRALNAVQHVEFEGISRHTRGIRMPLDACDEMLVVRTEYAAQARFASGAKHLDCQGEVVLVDV